VTFPVSTLTSQTRSINVPIFADRRVEFDESFNASIAIVSGSATLGTSSIAVDIDNDDSATVEISANPSSANEGNGGGTNNRAIDITVTGRLSANLVVNYATANGSAVSGSDYTAVSNSVTFSVAETASGSHTESINVAVAADAIQEPNENFFVNISSLSGGSGSMPGVSIGAGDDQAQVTLVNDDSAMFTIAADPVSAAEGTTTGSNTRDFIITLNQSLAADVDIAYSTIDGSATAGSDYTATSGILTFATGGSLTQTVSVDVNGDTETETNETFSMGISFSGPNQGASISTSSAQTTLVNDDVATLSIAASPSSDPEGDSNNARDFIITLNGTISANVVVAYRTVDGSALDTSDYSAVDNTVTFTPSGSTTQSQTVSVTVQGDSIVESDESFEVELYALSGPGTNGVSIQTAGGANIAEATLVNDDSTTVSLTSSPTTRPEGDSNSSQTFVVTVTGGLAANLRVRYATSDITATSAGANRDYNNTRGSLLFTPTGPTVQSFDVVIRGDNTLELDETFLTSITLAGAGSAGVILSGAPSTAGTVTTTLSNDDEVSFSIASSPTGRDEGEGDQRFTVSLAGSISDDVTVGFSTVDGTARVSDSDYVAIAENATNVLTFAPGDTQKTFDVTVNDDSIVEADETFSGKISNPLLNGVGRQCEQQSQCHYQFIGTGLRGADRVL